MAVGFTGEVEIWNGSAWAQQPAIPGLTFLLHPQSLSCASATFCVAVGFGSGGTQDAATWDGTAWTLQTTPLPGDGFEMSMNAVSCATASFCQAVGWYLTTSFAQATLAETWNGTTWTPGNSSSSSGLTASSLIGVWCTTPTFCAAVGEETDLTTAAALTLAQVWDGTAWTTQTSASRLQGGFNQLNSVWCDKHGACTAVGASQDRGGGFDATLVETNS